jgi:hypothetical protein
VTGVKKIVKEVGFFLAAAAVILPTSALIWAWMTGQTMRQVLYR